MNQVVEAVAHRQVGIKVEVLPNIRRWGPLHQHLVAYHSEVVPTADRNAVIRPQMLKVAHADYHAEDDVWTHKGQYVPLHPHLHRGLLARLVAWFQWR